jgi:hypothetical protein
MANASARTDFGRELAATTIRPGCDIVVAIAPDTRFPVHIRRISAHVLI